MTADRQTIRAAISNAFYEERNAGRTMEDAADRAANEVMALVSADAEEDAEDVEHYRHLAETAAAKIRAAEILRDDLLDFHGGHGDYLSAGKSLRAALATGHYAPDTDPGDPT